MQGHWEFPSEDCKITPRPSEVIIFMKIRVNETTTLISKLAIFYFKNTLPSKRCLHSMPVNRKSLLHYSRACAKSIHPSFNYQWMTQGIIGQTLHTHLCKCPTKWNTTPIMVWWLGGVVVKKSDWRSLGHGFNYWPWHCLVISEIGDSLWWVNCLGMLPPPTPTQPWITSGSVNRVTAWAGGKVGK